MSENKSKNENDEEQKKQRQKSAGKNKQGKKGEKFGRITTETERVGRRAEGESERKVAKC